MILTQRSSGANGRMSQTRSVLSMALVRTLAPSGEREMPVTVSVWPAMMCSGEVESRKSQILTWLSIPPLII